MQNYIICLSNRSDLRAKIGISYIFSLKIVQIERGYVCACESDNPDKKIIYVLKYINVYFNNLFCYLA